MLGDHLFIEDLEVSCHVGTTAEERAFQQVLLLSIRFELPLEKAGRTDDLNATVDYAAVVKKVRERIEGRTFNLVEAVAEAAAQTTLEHPLVRATTVRVGKKVFAGVGGVGAEIWRSRGS